MKIVFFLLLYILSLEAIITIAPVKLGEKPGFSGVVEGSFQTKRGNTEKDEYTAGLKMQYDNNESYLIWSDVIGTYGEANGVRNTNKTYAHIRFVHDITHGIDWETFIQSETNEFTKVERKRLAGLGVRFNYEHDTWGVFYLGLGGFYEYIAYTDPLLDPTENNARVNSYIAYVKTFDSGHSFAYVAYYQPRFDAFGDYISSQAVELKLHIIETLYLKFKIYYDVDTKPAVGVEETDFTQITSFTYEF